MIETISSSRAIRMVRSARNALLSSQVAALDLAKLSDTEAARLDFPENRARRLADAVGRPDMPIPVAMNLFEAAESFVDSALRRADEVAKQRRKERLSESSAEATASTAESEAEFDDQVEEAKEAAKAASTALSEAVEAAGLSRRAVLRSILTISKMRSEKSRSVLMLESLLISSVAQFELFASRLIATSLRFDTSPLAGDRTFTLEEFVNHDSVSSFMKSVRDSFVDSLMRESLEKWMKFLARATRSDTEWITDLLEEVVMRRNVHVHAVARPPAWT